MNASTPNPQDNPQPVNPADYWRRLCWVGDTRIALCGDLPTDRMDAIAQLDEWRAAGITHIVDVRGEYDDIALVARYAPHIRYHYLGTHDNGGAQDHAWFEAGAAAVVEALADPNAKVVIHCHMGVNRGPSMGFAAMLALGFGAVEALDAIRAARPIAAVLYAEDAVRWFTATERPGAASAHTMRRQVAEWHRQNPVDVGWVISRIRVAERSA